MYFPLTTLADAPALVRAELPPPLAGVVRQQIIEPREEEADRSRIPQLTPIVDPASIEVRRQYEQSPYPRWVHPASRGTPTPMRAYLGGLPDVRGLTSFPRIVISMFWSPVAVPASRRSIGRRR